MLGSQSETVLAAAIESIARVRGGAAYGELKSFSRHTSLLVQSAFYRSLVKLRPDDWQDFISGVREYNALIRLCAARGFAQLGTPEKLREWLDDIETDELLRLSADEFLFTPRQFSPEWISQPDVFNPNLARLPVRLTNFDPEFIGLNSNLDIDRQVHIMVMNGAS